jgi:hypothetical protein
VQPIVVEKVVCVAPPTPMPEEYFLEEEEECNDEAYKRWCVSACEDTAVVDFVSAVCTIAPFFA